MDLKVAKQALKSISRRVAPASGLAALLAFGACSLTPPQFPSAADTGGNPNTSNVNPNALAGHCIWVEGSEIKGRGYVTEGGDLLWTDGTRITALIDNQNIVVSANFTSSWDYTSGNPHKPRVKGVQIEHIYSLNPAVGTPSYDDVVNDPIFAAAAFNTDFLMNQAILKQDLSGLGQHVCTPPQAYGINGWGGGVGILYRPLHF